MKKIAFYLMNSKGFFVLRRFIEKFGVDSIAYVVSEQDLSIQYDAFYDLEKLALQYSFAFFRRKDFDASLENQFIGLKFAIGWRWLIKNEENLIVFHDSLLPRYRGFAPLVNSLIEMESHIGVTALFADSKYDRGDVIAQKAVQVDYPITIADAISIVEPLYFGLVDEIYSCIQADRPLNRKKQDEDLATYSLWLDKEDYFIDWSWPAQKIKNFVDAVGYPYDGAKARINDDIVILKVVDVVNDVVIQHRERHIGKVIFLELDTPIIVCSQGLLALKEVSNINREPLSLKFRTRFQ